MTGNVSKEERLRDYLLGRLSETEQRRLERRLLLEDRLVQIEETLAPGSPEARAVLEDELRSLESASDEEVEEREQAVRAELFDAYARGELKAEDRQWVDGRFLAESPEDRERLDFARVLAPVRRPAPGRWVWQAAAGLAATLAVVSALFLAQPGKHKNVPAAVLGAEVEIPWVAQRDAEIPQVPIPSEASMQKFGLDLPASAPAYSTFQVTVRDPDDQPVRKPFELSREGSDPVLHFRVAVGTWKTGTYYTFQISGQRKDGKWEPLGQTQVEILRK